MYAVNLVLLGYRGVQEDPTGHQLQLHELTHYSNQFITGSLLATNHSGNPGLRTSTGLSWIRANLGQVRSWSDWCTCSS